MRGMVRLLAINIVVTAILIAVAGGAAEAYLRLTIPSSSNESIFESTLETKRYKVMRRSARIVAWGSEFRTNSLGFRDSKDDIAPKPESGTRVVVLGDSFTVAAGVDIDQTYPKLLERALRADGAPTDVINLAVGGYNLIQEELVLDEVAWSLAPDVILVAAFPFNDLSNETYLANAAEAMHGRMPDRTPAYRQTYLYRAYLRRVEARFWRLFSSPAAPANPGREDTAPRENLDALARIVAKARARHVEVVVALLPNTDDFNAQRGLFAPFLKACAAHQWKCVDLIDDFAATGGAPESFRLNALDPHPNQHYNAVVAAALGDDLLPLVAAAR